jgi:hypothetical protein
MLSRFEELTLRNRIILAMMVGVILLLIPALLFTFILRSTRTTSTPTPPVKFEYCEAEPDALCILSFGRDGAGQAIINFFVPDKKFPDFYLIIKKAGAESRYECIRNKQIKTSVFCSGEALSLQQTIQVDIHANDDGRLLATGTFLLEAFLISTPVVDGTGTAAGTLQEPATTRETETSTPEVSETLYPDPYPYPYP